MLIFGFLISLLIQTPVSSFEVIGSIRNTQGQNVSGVRISVTDENLQPVYTAFVDSTGRFKVRLRTGKYIFRVETTGTIYQELETNWIELSSFRRNRGTSETYPLDLILRFRPGSAPGTRPGTAFVQEVPAAARSEFERALKNLKSKKEEAVISSLKKALEIFSDYFEALELLGTEYVKARQYELALPVLSRAITVNPRAPRSFYALGVAHLRLNQFTSALESLEKSAEFDPLNPNTQMMIGLAYGNSGVFDKSETAFRKALQTGGVEAAEAHFYLAGLYNKQHLYNEAWQELELYLKEAKDLKDPAQVRAMIANLRDKAASKAAEKKTMTASANAPKPLSSGNSPTHPSSDSPATGNSHSPPRQENAPNIDSIAGKRVPETLPPLSPEIQTILDKSRENGALMRRYLLDYTYQLKKTRRILNERGKTTREIEEVFEAYPVQGEHVLILLSRDGIRSRTIASDRNRAVRQLEQAEISRKSGQLQTGPSQLSETEDYVSAGIAGVAEGKSGYVSINISEFLRSCEFFSPRKEKVDERETLVMSFRPRAGARLASNYAYLTQLVGLIWIDLTDNIIIRLEGWPDTDGTFDLAQSVAPRDEAALIYQQIRQADGKWFPSLIRMNAGGRDLFNGLNWDVVFAFSGYQRFTTSAEDAIIHSGRKAP